MPRYIDADDLKAVIKANDWSNPAVPDVVGIIIDRTPTADVVEVVRCKDCKYRYSSEFCECRPEDAFCSDGEREGEG